MNVFLLLLLLFPSLLVAQIRTSSSCESRLQYDDDDSTDLGYDVTAQQNTFAPGDIVGVTISAPAAAHFRGITLYAMNDEEELIGDWFPPVRGLQRHYSAITCRSMSRAMIVERRFKKKSNQHFPLKFSWASPMNCVNGTNIQFRVIIGERRDLFQRNISFSIMCVDTVLMELCPFPTQGLENVNYNTSFEHWSPPVWIGTGRGPGGSWTLRQLATPSRDTGPERAYDGDYYVYLEASLPSAYRSTAILTTSQYLNGCFCLSFALSMNVQSLRGHTFLVRANNAVVYRTTERNENWEEIHIQFTQLVPTKISLEAVRGVNWAGDVALDLINIYSGLCRN